MTGRSRAIVFGNCQARGLEATLQANAGFARRFHVKRYPPVHEIRSDQVARLHASLERCDLLVVQRISEEYRSLGVGTKTLSAMAHRAVTVT